MSTSAEQSEGNPKTGMTHGEMKEFTRNHFEEFANRNNLRVGEVNFTAGFVDHGADVPPGLPTGPAGAIQYVGAALKQVSIEDLIAEDDKWWCATIGQAPIEHRSCGWNFLEL